MPDAVLNDATSLSAGQCRDLLFGGGAEACIIDRPVLAEAPYRPLIEALARGPGFRMSLNSEAPAKALTRLVAQLFPAAALGDAVAALAGEIERLASRVGEVAGGRPMVVLRTYFAPGDLVWHVDRMPGQRSVRLVWPIGRPGGMQVTAHANVDQPLYAAFMRREFPLLCRLDDHVEKRGGSLERLWAYRPEQVRMMQTGVFPFIRDAAAVATVPVGAASLHRVETIGWPGCLHRSDWCNRDQPGVQIVITASDSDA